MSEKYNTRQKQTVLTQIKNQTRDFAAKDIYESLNHEIGLTTIYRLIESLENDGTILRVSQENNSARYQYVTPCDEADHFYLKCEKCGKLTHIDCKEVKGLMAHISGEHHFFPTDTHIIINGFCGGCK